MSKLARLCLAAGLLSQSACVTVMPNHFRDRESRPETSGRQADQTRARIAAALYAEDADAISRVVSEDAFLVLQEGDTVRGRATITVLLAPSAAQHSAEFNRDGLHSCADGRFQDYGTFAIHGAGEAWQTSRTGMFSMVWSPADSGRIMLAGVTLYSPGAGRAYRRRPCPSGTDVQWSKPRAVVLFHPAVISGLARSWDGSMEDAMTSTGWTPAAGQAASVGARGSSAEAGNTLGLRAQLYRRLHISAGAMTLDGAAAVQNLDKGYVLVDYDGVAASVMPGLEWGRFSAAVGPAYVRLNGTWTTTWEMEHPPMEEEPSDWSSWAIGIAGEAAFIMPVSSRFAFDVRVQHRQFPKADVPGYRGSDEMGISFSHTSLLAGLAVRLF